MHITWHDWSTKRARLVHQLATNTIAIAIAIAIALKA
jgi:hypothetical protein